MSGSIPGVLDLIDGALRDYETSGDAMRWVPEGNRAASAEVPGGSGGAPGIETLIVVWAAGAAEAFMASMRTLAEAVWPILVEAAKSMSERAAALMPAAEEAGEARRREGSAMRREYRRRSLARGRRAR